ncbi:hypothetical protein [Thomasclavelia spiroformis]|uniref:hypothetical protein n=1 Tax=Thomasclavelia spiroformis TaxID=29348 RepID=UPI0039905AC0
MNSAFSFGNVPFLVTFLKLELTDSIVPGYLFHLLTNESYALLATFNDDAPYTLLINCVYFSYSFERIYLIESQMR